jgi:hypothetical protein
MIQRIAILGTGLLDTSAGLALRASGFTCAIFPESDLPADKTHFAEKNRAYFN